MKLRFSYVNWNGKLHEYVIAPEIGGLGELTSGHDPDEKVWCISGIVVTRDSMMRTEMGPTRRRTFALARMKDLVEVT